MNITIFIHVTTNVTKRHVIKFAKTFPSMDWLWRTVGLIQLRYSWSYMECGLYEHNQELTCCTWESWTCGFIKTFGSLVNLINKINVLWNSTYRVSEKIRLLIENTELRVTKPYIFLYEDFILAPWRDLLRSTSSRLLISMELVISWGLRPQKVSTCLSRGLRPQKMTRASRLLIKTSPCNINIGLLIGVYMKLCTQLVDVISRAWDITTTN